VHQAVLLPPQQPVEPSGAAPHGRRLGVVGAQADPSPPFPGAVSGPWGLWSQGAGVARSQLTGGSLCLQLSAHRQQLEGI